MRRGGTRLSGARSKVLAVALLGGNAGALIDDVQHGKSFAFRQFDMNAALARGELDGIGDQIVNHYPQLVGVSFYQQGRQLALEANGARGSHQAMRAQYLGAHHVERDRLRVNAARGKARLLVIDQFLDELLQAAAVLVDD